ncbi:nuclear pore complex protein NUP98B-like isoform X2 [Diospyros lotus]|uniref:nuclear pore complex protein NUP98B-like isoform X2 n=1 Tax=Diospyros lotus TaxID=55363 RepID=UPI002258C965|nr:nuclear pore complex protein NUP98B-like isoform X2 [Diospyros lotus]
MPVSDKPAAVGRGSSLLTLRHLSRRRIMLPVRNYDAKSDGPKVPFFSSDEMAAAPKADALLVPRENPRALVILPDERLPLRSMKEKMSHLAFPSFHVYKNDHLAENSPDITAGHGGCRSFQIEQEALWWNGWKHL